LRNLLVFMGLGRKWGGTGVGRIDGETRGMTAASTGASKISMAHPHKTHCARLERNDLQMREKELNARNQATSTNTEPQVTDQFSGSTGSNWMFVLCDWFRAFSSAQVSLPVRPERNQNYSASLMCVRGRRSLRPSDEGLSPGAPWAGGRVDLSAVVSRYTYSGFAVDPSALRHTNTLGSENHRAHQG